VESSLTSNDLSIAIMAGGKSVRMGTDKAFMPFRGRAMIEHVIDQISGLSSDIFIVTNRPESYSHLGYPTVSDIYPDCGPLGGIHAALHHFEKKYLLIVACDMPWLQPDLLKYMISLRMRAEAIVPRWERFPEPLHAIYGKSCLSAVEKSLQTGVRKVIGFYGKVNVLFIEKAEIQRFDPAGRSFSNLNTPGDLEDAEID
jgi:molybdopterin-guanine dinucleotide biosynthesis protein A